MCHNDRFSHVLGMCHHTCIHHPMSHMLDTLHKTNKPSWTPVRGAKSSNLSLRGSTASSSKFHLKSATEERRNKLITHYWLRHRILSVFQEQRKFETSRTCAILNWTKLFPADQKMKKTGTTDVVITLFVDFMDFFPLAGQNFPRSRNSHRRYMARSLLFAQLQAS